jgi:putative DNA primase/helicase
LSNSPKPSQLALDFARGNNFFVLGEDDFDAPKTWVYKKDIGSFYRYSEGECYWRSAPDQEIRALIRFYIGDEIPGGFREWYVSDTLRLLKDICSDMGWEWDNYENLLPVANGMLNMQTKELEDHSPIFRNTWCLPHKYDPDLTCQPIIDWLTEATCEKQDIVQLLRAYLNAVLKGRNDIQRYLELVGFGGTGKTTFLNLAIELVGRENCASRNLQDLNSNRFSLGDLVNKRLVVFPDQDEYNGPVGKLKALTGQDVIMSEQKYKSPVNFVYKGMVIITANKAMQSTDYSSGLERRRITVPFNHVPEKRRNLMAEFTPLIPGLINWVLELTDKQVTSYLIDTKKEVPSLESGVNERLMETNPIAAWLEECVVLDPKSETQIGTKDGPTRPYQDSETQIDTNDGSTHPRQNGWLYASYYAYAKATGLKILSQRAFTPALIDLCRNQLKHKNIEWFRKSGNGSRFIRGLALRSDNDSRLSPIIGMNSG